MKPMKTNMLYDASESCDTVDTWSHFVVDKVSLKKYTRYFVYVVGSGYVGTYLAAAAEVST